MLENRYLVIKNEDIESALRAGDLDESALNHVLMAVKCARLRQGKLSHLEGIFIGKDWPEYQAAHDSLVKRTSNPTR